MDVTKKPWQPNWTSSRVRHETWRSFWETRYCQLVSKQTVVAGWQTITLLWAHLFGSLGKFQHEAQLLAQQVVQWIITLTAILRRNCKTSLFCNILNTYRLCNMPRKLNIKFKTVPKISTDRPRRHRIQILLHQTLLFSLFSQIPLNNRNYPVFFFTMYPIFSKSRTCSGLLLLFVCFYCGTNSWEWFASKCSIITWISFFFLNGEVSKWKNKT